MHKELVYLKGFAKGKGYWEMIKAIKVAVTLHEGQKRKAGGDYVEHPMKVCSHLVALKVYDEVLLTAALLHDVVEDCGISRMQLITVYGFSEEVADLVFILSKDKGISTALYYQNLKTDIRAILIKISDRGHNISTMVNAFSEKKMVEYIQETEEFVLPLCKYGIDYYPQYSDEIVVMRDAIESLCYCIDSFICMMNANTNE